ncbi:MAG: hypothetical protein ABJR23_15975, partial [Paracoccaceae bacterium]
DSAPVLEEARLEIKSMALTSAMSESFAGLDQNLALDVAPTVCDINVTAQPEMAAMVRISLKAPCLGNERVTVHHSGMMFTETTAADGSLRVLVPALTENAFFMLGFADGATATVQASVDGLQSLDRVVVQWRDNPGFELHAREFGADYGGNGHVWASAARNMKVAQEGEGGFLTRVGDANAPEPLMAEIYTYPSGTTRKTGSITLSLETEVTAANCGHDVRAQSLEMRGYGSLKSQNLIMSVPDCDAVGDFLVLNNLLEDLKVASN